MSNTKSPRATWRALLTDTLPYEVPVIFSNEKYFAALIAKLKSEPVALAFSKIIDRPSSTTIPYCYNIRKERGSFTTLGVIHPLCQKQIAEFCEDCTQSLLAATNRSEYSLRHPVGVTPLFSDAELSGEKTFKLGIPHVDPDEGEIDVSHVTSFFSYGKFNLLSKFIESADYIDLEKRFSRLRTLDVTKCFFNIYTHTVTWAVKSREFAKDNRTSYSFEGLFDGLMQKANYSETHGIVIGPEVSRIFAEIIFQDIDRRVLEWLASQRCLHGRDYAIRRYVDDYFVFANDEAVLDRIEAAIRQELQYYKLFVNENKRATTARPFVSPITLARRELRWAFRALQEVFGKLPGIDDPRELRRAERELKEQVFEIRLIVAKHQIGFHTISGWLLSSIRRTLRRMLVLVSKTGDTARAESLTGILTSVMQLAFYVVSLDLRVRTTYSLCQFVSVMYSFIDRVGRDYRDRLQHVLAEELETIISAHLVRLADGSDAEVVDSVELFNLLICGAHYVGETFLKRKLVRDVLTRYASRPVTYFGYITLKFCMLKDAAYFGAQMAQLNESATSVVEASSAKVRESTHVFLLFCDLMSAPDLSISAKRSLFKKVYGQDISATTVGSLQPLVGFVDWEGLRITHLLARKELIPVYAWS